jgi:hypothetical protein
MKRNNLLEYYQKHTQAAFAQGFTEKLYNEVVGSEVYEVHKFYLPTKIGKRVKFLRRYFEFLDNEVPKGHQKRRQSPCEFAETAMFALTRIKMLTEKGYTIIAGSQHVSPIPWAIFGPPNQRPARFYYKNIDDLAGQYHNYMHGKMFPIELHFRVGSGLASKLAARHADVEYLSSPNYWMALGICVLFDIIHNCGPDCHEFYELFTNDYKDNPQTIDFKQWQRARCKILGIAMPPSIQVYPKQQVRFQARSLNSHSKPERMKTQIVEISNDQDLTLGETTRPLYYIKTTTVPQGEFPTIGLGPSEEFLPIEHDNPHSDIDFGIRGRQFSRTSYRYNILPP